MFHSNIIIFPGIDVKRKVTDYYEIWSDSRPERSDIKLHSGFYYHGDSPLEHQIGDLRIHFSYAGREDDIVSVNIIKIILARIKIILGIAGK